MKDGFFWAMGAIIVFMILGWCYLNTAQVHDYTTQIQQHLNTIDSLETRVAKLEYFIENEPKTININVTTNKNNK